MSETDGIGYDRRGSGEPLVLVHGLGGTRRIWLPVLEMLAAERDVVSVDLPGFGESAVLAGDERATAVNMGERLREWWERELGLERPHVAGNSLGAWVALEVAKTDRVASVCGLSPAGLWSRPLGPRAYNLRRLGQAFGPALDGLIRSPRSRAVLLRTTLAHPERLSPDEASALLLDWLHSPGYDDANAQMRANVFERPELVRVPTTIANGSEDRLVRAPRRDRMPPQTHQLVLEGCGHTPTWDDPELVTRVLLEASAAERSASLTRGARPDAQPSQPR